MTDDAIRELFGQVPYFVDQKIEKYVPGEGDHGRGTGRDGGEFLSDHKSDRGQR